MADLCILVVCTANICRSPAAQVLLQAGLPPLYRSTLVTSAGTHAHPDDPACAISSTLLQKYVSAADWRSGEDVHRSRRVSPADLQQADLVLALDRSHRAELARLLPTARSRTFTLRHAAAAAGLVSQDLRAGTLPEGAPGLPDEPIDRFRWWVGELDAVRALVPVEAEQGKAPLDDAHPLDVPDPHVVGRQYHPMAIELIVAAVAGLVESLAAVAQFGASPR